MKIEAIRIHGKNGPEEKTRWTAALVMPRFSEEAEGRERLNAFYERLAEEARGAAARLSCTVLSELKIACREDTFYSLVLDFLFYRGRRMLRCERLTDTRLWNGTALPPPREVGRRIPKNGGWYFDGKRYVLYQNVFTPEQGSGVRRSAYGIFLPEEVF